MDDQLCQTHQPMYMYSRRKINSKKFINLVFKGIEFELTLALAGNVIIQLYSELPDGPYPLDD